MVEDRRLYIGLRQAHLVLVRPVAEDKQRIPQARHYGPVLGKPVGVALRQVTAQMGINALQIFRVRGIDVAQ